MANDETTEPVEEEDVEDEEDEAAADEGTADPVPGAVTEDTPEPSKKELKAGAGSLPSGGWAQLTEAIDVDGVEVPAGTRVQIVDTEAEIVEGISHDPYHPQIELPEGGEIVVRTRDARGLTFGVTAEDLEPVAAGATKGG